MQKPFVSVIVTTKNEEKVLDNLLKSITIQSYSPIELIVVDNNSEDKTTEIARKYTQFVYNRGPERSAQRNFGAGKAKGEYLLFLDADMELTPHVISHCAALASKNHIATVIIPEKSVGKGFWAACKALERVCYLGDETIEAARFFDKNVFFEFGGYDEQITGPEDWDLPQRIKKKYPSGRITSFILHNEKYLSIWLLLKKKYYYGKKAKVYAKKHQHNIILPQTIYILRPAFYKHWKLLLSRPILSMGMIAMLFGEQIAGFLGFIVGEK